SSLHPFSMAHNRHPSLAHLNSDTITQLEMGLENRGIDSRTLPLIMAGAGNWCLIESDPGVFTEIMREVGVKGLEVEELVALDPVFYNELEPIYGLIFLFKWRESDVPTGIQVANPPGVFFAQQVISNACATQALVNLLLNIDRPNEKHIELGETLTDFKSFCNDFDPASRGLCLSNSDAIRSVHNSFSRQQLFELDIKGGKEEDNYHFVCYVPKDGKIYELDGLQDTPYVVGEVGEGVNWMDVVTPAIQQRIQKYAAGEIHFNLMALVGDRKEKAVRRLEEIATSGMETEDVAGEVCDLQQLIADLEEKTKKHKIENIRRRHNYLPLIVEVLRVLAKEDKLVPLVEQAIDNAVKKKKARDESEKVKAKA
ncbi:hypothetical protein PENTCL1PPCAC_27041, partial [Pristionchus entomophagus]